MSKRHNLVDDAVQSSVRGTRTIAFGGVPYAAANDAINRAWDEKLRKISNKREEMARHTPAPAAPCRRSVFGHTG